MAAEINGVDRHRTCKSLHALLHLQEISAYFTRPEKWALKMAQLRDPGGIEQLRLFHQEAHHVADVLDALSSGGSVTSLEIHALDPLGAKHLSSALADPSCSLRQLRLPQLGSEAAGGIASGLTSNSSLQDLQLSGLGPACVQQVAHALQGRRTGATLYTASHAHLLLPGLQVSRHAS